jgi:hypothetical protein
LQFCVSKLYIEEGCPEIALINCSDLLNIVVTVIVVTPSVVWPF